MNFASALRDEWVCEGLCPRVSPHCTLGYSRDLPTGESARADIRGAGSREARNAGLSAPLKSTSLPMNGLVECCRIPPMRRKKVAWMGHGSFLQEEVTPGWVHLRTQLATASQAAQDDRRFLSLA